MRLYGNEFEELVNETIKKVFKEEPSHSGLTYEKVVNNPEYRNMMKSHCRVVLIEERLSEIEKRVGITESNRTKSKEFKHIERFPKLKILEEI